MKGGVAVALGVLALAACSGNPPTSPRGALTPSETALHATMENLWDFLSFQTVNPCNGETIDASGPMHAVTRATNDGAGGLHIGGTENAHFDGVGETTSNAYVANLSSALHLNARPPFPYNTTTTFELNFVAKGKALNFAAHFNTHMTVSANGDVTVDGGEIEGPPVCRDVGNSGTQ